MSEAAKTDTLPLGAQTVKIPVAILLLAGGTAILALGARLLVSGAVNIAVALGISSLVVGLTVVAVATSLPELATSVVAILRGERDMAVGNIVGSNIFNIGMVLGLSAIVFGEGIPVPDQAIALDMPIMVATAIALLPVAFIGFAIARWEGTVFVALFTAYMVFVVLIATQHQALNGFTQAMLWFVLPLLALTWLTVGLYLFGKNRKNRDPLINSSS